MAQPVYISDNEGNPLIGAMVLPLLLPVGYLGYLTWQGLSARGTHPMFEVLAVAGEAAAILYATYFFFRVAPPFLSITATALYMGGTYAWVASLFVDPTWTSGIAIAAAIGGFFLGKFMADAAKDDARRYA